MNRKKGLSLIGVACLINLFCFLGGSIVHNWFNFYVNGLFLIVSYWFLIDELKKAENKARGFLL